MDWHRFLADWQDAATARGFHTESLLDKDGYPIWASSKGDPTKPTVYLSSGVHGDEPAGPQALLALLREDFFDDRFHWLICPALNPTGLQRNTRENAQGIDLNRDYLLCQTPEVCAHIAWLKSQPVPQLFLSLHEDWESTGFYYYEINTGTQGPTYRDILAAAAPHFPPEPEQEIDDHPVTKPGWIFHPDSPDIPEGWPEAIYLARHGCPLSLTFETPSSRELPIRIACHQSVIRRTLDVTAAAAQ